MGVSETSIVDWEAGKLPYDRMYPTIIAFLGYEPWAEPVSLAEKLVAARRRHGLSAKAAAKLIEVDEATYGRWERGREPSSQRHQHEVARFLTGRLSE